MKADISQWIHGDGTDLCVDIQYDDTLSKQVRALDVSSSWLISVL